MFLPSCSAHRLPRVMAFATRVIALAAVAFVSGCHRAPKSTATNDLEMQGRQIFRYDTFGDEQFWNDTARLNELVDKRIEPEEALRLGLKVDMEKLDLGRFIAHNPLSTGGTKELLKEDAV